MRKTRRDRPVISATASPPKRWRIWSSAACTGGNAASFSIRESRAATASWHKTGLPSASVTGRLMRLPSVVGEGFLQLHGKGVRQIFQACLPRRQVDGDVAPFRDGDIGDAPVQQGLAGGDQLDHAGMAGLEIGLHGPDQRGAFHGGQEMAEKALLRSLESRLRGGLRVLVEGGIALHDAGGFQRVFYVAVDHLEGPSIGVVDAPLLRCQGMFEQLNLDPVIAERTGLVEPECFQIAGNHLHRRDPAGLHGGDEIGALFEGRLAARIRAAPQAEAARIGQAGHCGGPGGGRHRGYAHRARRSANAIRHVPVARAPYRRVIPWPRRRWPWRGPRRTR